jgi:hypothetical protein
MKNLNHPAALIVVLAWLACLPATLAADAPPPEDLDATLGTMRRVIERYSTDQSSLGRFDGTPMSPERYRRLNDFYEGWQRATGSLDFEALDPDGRIDYLLLRNDLAHRLHTLEHQRRRDEEVQPLVPFWQPIVELEQARKRMEWAEPAASAEKLAKLSRGIADARKAIDEQAGLDRVRPLSADLQQIIHGLPATAAASATDGGNGRRADEAAEEDEEEVVDAEFTRD